MDLENVINKIVDKSKWKTYRFDELVKNIVEKVVPKGSGLEHYIGLEHLDSGSVHIKRFGETESLIGDKLKIYKGDIIFAKRNAYLKRASISPIDGVASAHSLVLRMNEETVDKRFFPFFLMSEYFWERAIEISVGSLSPTINWKTLAKQEFLLPPKDQQAELAELLWAMDTVIEKDLEVLERLEKYKIVKSKVLFSQFDKTVKLSDVATIIMGQSPDGKTYNEQGDGIPFIQGNAEFSSVGPINKLFTTAPTKLCKEGDILISVRAPVGDLNIAQKEFCIGRGLAAIRLNDESLKHYVYEFLLNSKHILDSKSSGSTFKSINKDVLSDLDIQITDSKSVLNNLLIFYESANLSLKQLKSKLQSSKALQKALINQIF